MPEQLSEIFAVFVGQAFCSLLNSFPVMNESVKLIEFHSFVFPVTWVVFELSRKYFLELRVQDGDFRPLDAIPLRDVLPNKRMLCIDAWFLSDHSVRFNDLLFVCSAIIHKFPFFEKRFAMTEIV